MYVDVNTLKNTAYKNFFSQLLKNTEYVIISMIDGLPRFTWDIAHLPENVNFHAVNFFEGEQLYCFRNNYFDIFSTLNLYNSIKEFLDLNDVYRLMFVTNNEVVVYCMCDEVIMYNI
jgi:hypothetical protein